MTRIISGRAGGLRLQTPKGGATRPTSDRVREALFSAIESWAGSLQNLRVLDLYAGSGALGLEAWSRGAESVTLVESDKRTAELVRANARAIGCPAAEVISRPVSAVLVEAGRPSYDVILSDPPYPLTEEALAKDLGDLVANGWLSEDALVVVERSRRSPEPTWPPGLQRLEGRRGMRKYGETIVWLASTTVSP